MQFTKDSFYMALRERLIALNPQRVVTLNGVTRPAVIVAENEAVVPVEPLPDAFYIEWGAVKISNRQAGAKPLMAMECVISHHTLGTVESEVDRGRTLAELDTELLSICQPQHTAKQDFTQAPSVDLGTNIFWTLPELGEISGIIARESTNKRVQLERKASVTVFFSPEVNFQ
jgi:hypothetical protein